MKLDPADPYPLIDLSSVPYAEQKLHAAQVDAWLGFEIERVESQLELAAIDRELMREQWIGLPAESLQTPYTELRTMLDEVVRGRDPAALTIADLGAGYGRLAFVVQAHAREARFIGLELARARVDEGNRVYRLHGLDRAELRCANLLDGELPPADVYFTYDFGSQASIRSLLEKLRLQAQRAPITVVGRGRATRDEIERKHPWLGSVVPPLSCGNFSIYRSA